MGHHLGRVKQLGDGTVYVAPVFERHSQSAVQFGIIRIDFEGEPILHN